MTIEQVPANTIADLKTLLKTTQVPDKIMAMGPELIQYLTHIKASQLSDTDHLGFDLGSAGILTLIEQVVNTAFFDHFHMFDDAAPIEPKLTRKILVLYHLKPIDDQHFLLHLKQLDY
ncbi:hypothetical protein [Latilactobacillus curvatus]|uniref:hypothetical protein n=1 Tax=Latilactobacillus curvatus TaxID=28038 RepID=UPI00345E25B8